MTKDKDIGSDAARSDPEAADQDREALKKRAEENIERSKRDEKSNRVDGTEEKHRLPSPGSEAAEPSPE